MYLRVSVVRRGPHTYRYAQLVESFRRPDGTPTNRVLASLGALDDLAIENLRAALKGARGGQAVVLPAATATARGRVRIRENLQYLNVAVLLQLWRSSGLGRLIAEVAGCEADEMALEHVTAALVLQRCVAPGSKLAAERWYPRTALPELQAVPPERFNNSRVHRALTALDRAEAEIQKRLAPLVIQGEGPFTTLFIDATDTWFVGTGPPLAQKGLDKEGLYRRRMGLVLLCDQRGFPLRWHTLSGRYHDPTALAEMAQEAAALPWAKGVPVVMDRASGNAGAVDKLHSLGVHYVTALPAPEFESCGAPIPWDALEALQGVGGTDADAVARVCARAEAAGFVRIHATRYVYDLGTIDKARPADAPRTSQALFFLRLVESAEANPGTSHPALAEQAGVSARTLRRYLELRRLSPAVRERIRAGDADGLGFKQLHEIAEVGTKAQLGCLHALLKALPDRRRHIRLTQEEAPPSFKARAVLSFNPVRFVEDRRADTENLARVEENVADINRRLAHPSSRRTDASALAEVEQQLGKYGLRAAVTPTLANADGTRTVSLQTDASAWARRRRGDGINVIVAHHDLPGTAADLVHLYFAKDAIEKDFQTIKSFVELRPIHHRTDPKLRAHVTVCVLALLLNRLLAARLHDSEFSPRAALERLEPVRLNIVEDGAASYYTVTQPSEDADTILRALQLTELTDDTKVCAVITPR